MRWQWMFPERRLANQAVVRGCGTWTVLLCYPTAIPRTRIILPRKSAMRVVFARFHSAVSSRMPAHFLLCHTLSQSISIWSVATVDQCPPPLPEYFRQLTRKNTPAERKPPANRKRSRSALSLPVLSLHASVAKRPEYWASKPV